jgi:hypothetical protein
MAAPRIFGICILALLAASCSSGSISGAKEGLPYAAAAQSCGPADGPAVSIYLTPTLVSSLDPVPPYVRIDVWQPLDRLTERPWTLSSGSAADADGAAVYYTGAPELEVATSGRVTVSTVAPDRSIHGFADLRFPTLGRVRGEFHALWNSRRVVCG